jgi:hypothetical protein
MTAKNWLLIGLVVAVIVGALIDARRDRPGRDGDTG